MKNFSTNMQNFVRGLIAVLILCFAQQASSIRSHNEKVEIGDIKEQRVNRAKPQRNSSSRMTRNEAFIFTIETRLLREITRGMNVLQRTASQMPKRSAARLELMEKLVNLRLEAAVFHAAQEMREYDQAWEKWDANGRKGREPRLSDRKSKSQWAILSREAASLLKEYPKSKNSDNTMFNMALAQNFLGNEAGAARIFSQLIQKYPNSQKSGDAYFALGDFYFDKSDFRNAMNNYRNALRFKQSKAYAWAMFKLAWCYYNLGDYARSLAYWKATVVTAGRGDRKGLALKEEALRDMVYAFAELKQIEPAIQYYKRNGGQKYVGRFLLLLSQTFSYQGQFGRAILTLKRYQQEAPYDEATPDSQKEIILLYYELGKWPNLWAELANFPKLYGNRSPWAARNRKDRKRVLEVQKMIKDQIMYYAKKSHKDAQKDDNKGLYAEAMKGYLLFLRHYPRDKEMPEVKFNMADIEYFSKDYRGAGKLYYEIAALGKERAIIINPNNGKTENIHQKASEYMLDAFLKDYEPELKVLLKQKPDFKKPPRKLSPKAQAFVGACGRYKKWYPNDKKNVKTCDVFIAEIFYRTNNRKFALSAMWNLARKYPGTKEGNEAVENIIPLYQNDKVGLAKAAGTLLKIPAYARGKLGDKLRALERATRIDLVKEEKSSCKRAEEFEKLYKQNPRATDADAIIDNAAADHLKCGNVPGAITAYMTILKSHPKSPAVKNALYQVAVLNEARLELAGAAPLYYQYGTRYINDKQSEEEKKQAIGAMARACELYAAIESSQAITSCLNFAKIDGAFAKEIFQRMLRSAFSSRNGARLSDLLKVYISRFNLSADERISAYAMLYNGTGGQGPAAQQAAQDIMSTFRSSGGNVAGEPLRMVGQLVFAQVNGEMARYEKLALRGGSVEALQSSIEQKATYLQKLRGAYDQVIATKDPYWGIAALYQSGYAWEQLALSLENPPEITGAAHAEVAKQLSGDAMNARKEAAGFYRVALESVSKYMVYNDWAAKSLSGLARISGKPVTFDDFIVAPDLIGAEVPVSIAKEVGGD